jgi:Right handed beta helix region
MKKRMRCSLGLIALAALLSPAAYAQATRTWVSGVGDDVNPCSRTAPCKTFAGAISKTAAGGEISVLDPGGFGAVTITKAITINGDGTLAGILASLTNGIVINAGVNDRVILRNLSLNGAGNGLDGIRWLAGKSLLVDNVTIVGFTGDGIDVAKTAAGNLHVKNTTITQGSTNTTGTGIRLNTTAGLLLAMIEDSHIGDMNNGIEVAVGRATISNSVISGNASHGILASNAAAVVNVEGCQIAFNALVGVNASVSGATIRVSNNEIYNNTTGINIAAGGIVNSAGNNRVFGNGGSAAVLGPAIVIQ